MPNLKTLRQIRDKAKRRAGLRGDKSLSNADWTEIINDSIERIWREATSANVGYGQTSVDIVGVPGQEEYAFPADHATTISLFRPLNGTTGQLQRVERTTETAYRQQYFDDQTFPNRPGFYWYTATGFVLRPVPTGNELIKILYVTAPPQLVNETDTIDTVIDWTDAIVEWACGDAQMDEIKRQAHMARAREITQKAINNWGNRRDRGPLRISQIRRGLPRNNQGDWRY